MSALDLPRFYALRDRADRIAAVAVRASNLYHAKRTAGQCMPLGPTWWRRYWRAGQLANLAGRLFPQARALREKAADVLRGVAS